MKKDLAKQIYKDSGWQIDQDTKTTDYKPAPYCIFGEENAGKVPVGREDGLIEFKDYGGGSGDITNFTQSVINNDTNKELTITNVVDGVAQQPYTINYGGSGTELPIKYEETYDITKVIPGYLTAFADTPNGLYFRLENSYPKCLPTIDYRFDGEILRVNVNGNTLYFDRYNQPDLSYTPSVSADITSYNYSDTSAHTISGRAEANWWLIIPKSSFGSTTNILNVRSIKATAGNVDLSSSTMVSVWKVVDATSLPEAIVIDPNATIGDLMVLLDVRNTSNAQVSVDNVEFVIQATIGATINYPLYQHTFVINNNSLNKTAVFSVLSNSNSIYTLNGLLYNKIIKNIAGVACIISEGQNYTYTLIASNGTDFIVGGNETWSISNLTLVADEIIDLSETDESVPQQSSKSAAHPSSQYRTDPNVKKRK